MVMRWICKSGEIGVAGVVDMGDTIMGVVLSGAVVKEYIYVYYS